MIVRAVALEDGGGDLAPGLGIGDRHELAAVVEVGGDAELLLAAARKRTGDRPGRPGFDPSRGDRGVAEEIGAGSGNRTRTSSLGSWQATVTSYPRGLGL